MQTTVFYSLGRCGHFAPQGRKSVALLVAALLLLFAGNARAGGLESFHGTWVFSKKATCVRLAATGNPEAANCEKTPDLADGLLG